MNDIELLKDKGVLVLHPGEPISSSDIRRLSNIVDPYFSEHGKFGVLVEADKFPGWADFDSFLDHMKFVKAHHEEVARVAIVSDNEVLKRAPALAERFGLPAVRVFHKGESQNAMSWVRTGA